MSMVHIGEAVVVDCGSGNVVVGSVLWILVEVEFW